LAPYNLNDFDSDISPLLHYLWRQKYIDESNYLGIVQFGTETFHSLSNVTFSVRDFNISIHSGRPNVVSEGSLPVLPNLTWVIIATYFGWVLSV
jgi:xyloglucan-specific endo-beta-1,4-glucanase